VKPGKRVSGARTPSGMRCRSNSGTPVRKERGRFSWCRHLANIDEVVGMPPSLAISDGVCRFKTTNNFAHRSSIAAHPHEDAVGLFPPW